MGCFDTLYLRYPTCGKVKEEQVYHGPQSLSKWNGKTVPRAVAIQMLDWKMTCDCGKGYSVVWIEPAGPLMCVPDDHFAEIPEDPWGRG